MEKSSINVLKLLISVIQHFAFIVFLLTSNSLSGQTTFSHLSHSGFNCAFGGVVQIDDGFICQGGFVNTTKGVDYFGTLYKLDNFGNFTDSLIIGSFDDYINARIEVIDKFSDGTILAGFFKFDEIRKILLIHFTQELEVLNSIEIQSPFYDPQVEDSDFVDLSCLVIDETDNIYLSLNLSTAEESNFLGVLKYTESFSLLWDYYDSDAISNSVTDLIVDSSGVIFGENAIDSPSNTPTIQKLNSLGELEWSFQFQIEEELFSVSPRNIVLQNNNVVVGSFMRFEGMERSSPVVVSMDIEGNQEWITIVNPNPVDGSSIDALSKTCDDGFIAGARSTVPVIENDSLVASDILEAQLIRFNTQGEILWKRNFRLIDNPTAEHEIRQVEQTADNGFVMVGEYINTNINDTTNIFPYQRQLIIKTDACGCLVPNCDPECSRANCEDFPVFEDENFLLLGPSPTSGTLNVFVANVSSDKNHSLKLFSSSGALILEESNVVPDVTYIFDLSNVSPGIYFAQLLNNEGVVQTEKFVKF